METNIDHDLLNLKRELGEYIYELYQYSDLSLSIAVNYEGHPESNIEFEVNFYFYGVGSGKVCHRISKTIYKNSKDSHSFKTNIFSSIYNSILREKEMFVLSKKIYEEKKRKGFTGSSVPCRLFLDHKNFNTFTSMYRYGVVHEDGYIKLSNITVYRVDCNKEVICLYFD